MQPQLTIAESQLAEIQQCHVDTLALLVGIHWREKRELSPGYLARVVASRATRQLALPLKHPTSSSICYTKDDMIDTTSTFYSALYTPHPVDQVAIDDLLRSLPEDLHITETEQNHLTRPIKYDKLLEGVLRCPSRSSPGTDGFTYKLLSVIFQLLVCREILLDVYNTALNDGVFSVSWQETCISLLPKKGDLSHLKNWRPISLINTDAKIFTRIPNARMMQFTNKLITPFQTGFVRDRFIADNGLLMKLTMYHTRNTGSQSIGLMLDQEKAYDRIHPEYLKQVLLRFGFPSMVVHSLSILFFGTQLRINMNGFLPRQFPNCAVCDKVTPFHLSFSTLLLNRSYVVLLATQPFVISPCLDLLSLILRISICSRSTCLLTRMIWSAYCAAH